MASWESGTPRDVLVVLAVHQGRDIGGDRNEAVQPEGGATRDGPAALLPAEVGEAASGSQQAKRADLTRDRQFAVPAAGGLIVPAVQGEIDGRAAAFPNRRLPAKELPLVGVAGNQDELVA